MKKKWGLVLAGIATMTLLTACGDKKEVENEEKPKENVTTKQPTETKHESYETYKEQIAKVKESIDKYTDVQVAIDAGYRPSGPYVPGMGYHFVNAEASMEDPENPNTLLYVLDEKDNFVLVAGEWTVVGDEQAKPVIFDGIEWTISTYAGGHYEDGTILPSETPNVPKEHPETGAKLVTWMPNVYGIHMYTHLENEKGVFADFNDLITNKYDANAKGKTVAPIQDYLPEGETTTGH